MWDMVGGAPKAGRSRKGKDYCGKPMTCSGCGWGCAQPYPGDGAYNGTPVEVLLLGPCRGYGKNIIQLIICINIIEGT